MSKIQKELEDLTSIKQRDYKEAQEFLMALMNHINDEGEDFFKELNEEIQSWFNQNVDCISNSESLIGFDEDVPEETTTEEPFGEYDEQEQEDDEEGEEIDLEDYDEITLEDVKVDQRVLIMLDDESGVEGKVIKKLKVALKLINENEEEIKVANKKIAAIYLYNGTDAEVNDFDEEEEDTRCPVVKEVDEKCAEDYEKSKKMEVIEEKDVAVETKKFIEENQKFEGKVTVGDEHASPKELKEVEKIVEKEGFAAAVEYVQETNQGIKGVLKPVPEVSKCQCSKSKGSMKQVLYHISEIFRIISDEM